MAEEAITFPAEIIKVQTMQDGAIRITLDLPADKVATAAKLMEAKQRGCVLEVAAVAIDKQIKSETTGNGRKIHI
ncbi:MAG: hypothetical protein EHM33_01020 [Chloroflexi bacterium]|nr:MAG: hypothetical protein EHM33_01020 [Chloroflexota bacterium]